MASLNPSNQTTNAPQVLFGKRALIVGGDRRERQRLLEFLSGWGIAVDVTDNPVQGLSLLWGAIETEKPFDLTLFSPHGHRVLGEQFASLVKSDSRLAQIPMLHIGNSNGANHKAPLQHMGFFDTLPLPVDKTLLFDALHRACGELAPSSGIVRLMDRHTALGRSSPRLGILLAEPDREQRRIICNTLTRGGHQVFEVESGEQVSEALAKHSFDLVIVSLEPAGFGTTAALELFRFSVAREDWPAFIGLSCEPNLDQMRDYARLGITVVIPSPIQPQDLLGAIAEVVRGNNNQYGTIGSAEIITGLSSPEAACLDERVLHEIERLSLDPDFLNNLIQEFLANVGALLDDVVRTKGSQQCFARLREFGHVLQDNAGSLGALQLYQLGLIASQYPAELFELDGEQLLSRIESAYQKTRSAFWQYLRRRELSRSPG
jgi:two-component system, sensor histidine kinase RpfC